MGNNQGRSAIGGTSTLGSDQRGTITYGAMTEQIVKQLQSDPKGEYVVIRKGFQSEPAKVWSTGDPEQTRSTFRDASEQLSSTTEPAGT